ncbi:MAG: DNA-3-methyladenine glycosylase [Candidatus Saccharibacteria bacterium]|nr:DNA-3-methyladenine glycosylase [Candidatus Saccharibacteria bacterium]
MSRELDFLSGAAVDAAPQLLGCVLERTIGDTLLRVRIVETEAYDQTDIASHSYNGQTPRTTVMFGEPGHLYVYFTYGMHYCCNIVTGPKGHGAAVLIRAVQPLSGEVDMQQLRGEKSGVELTNGPAKTCQALSIDRALNGHDISLSPLILTPGSLASHESIIQTTRIGLSKGSDIPWRFYIKDNPYVSRE